MKSNCLLGAIYIRARYPNSKIHVVRSDYSPFPHFCVEYNNKVIWFCSKTKDEHWYQQLWYEGSFKFKNKKR